MMPANTILFVLQVGLAALPQGNSAEAQFEAGLQAFDAGHFEDAAKTFAALRAQGFVSGWLAYNLGNSQLRAGSIGEAIAAYRWALADLPRHSDIRANLAFARRRVQDAIAPPEPSVLVRSLLFWHYVFNVRESLWATALLTALFWLLRLPPLFGRQARLLHNLSALSGAGALAVGISLALHVFAPSQVGVVLAEEVDVLTVNEPQAPVRFRLHAGTEAQVTQQLDGWLLLELSDGKQGWVKKDVIALVAH